MQPDGAPLQMTTGVETEVKIRIGDTGEMSRRLQGSGFSIAVPRDFEANTLFDTPDRSLGRNGMLLRLRQVGGKGVITWKGRGLAGPHKSRPELETSVGSLETLQEILGHVGYDPLFRYEKYRTEFRQSESPGLVTLDETPIGNFLELEGPAAWIDATAHMLGFSPQSYILESYGKLYLSDCERRGVQPGHMVFASHT
jgi:adenylate cyclase, class 2